MKNIKKQQRMGRSEFSKNLNFIKKGLSHNKSASQIHDELKKSNLVSMDISVFRRYIRELKAEIAAKSNQSKFSAKPPTPIIPSVPPSTSQSKVFNPQALDSKQLDDEFGITSSDDSDETSQGSEVSHG